MRPLSLLRAKPALPVLGRPLLHWTLETLAAHGVTDVIVNLHHLPATVTRAVGDGSAFGLRVAYSREPRILGTGGGLRKARRLLGDEPFFAINGDVVFDFDLTRLLRRHRETRARATLAVRRNPDPRRYPPVVSDGRGRVRAIRGLPAPGRGTASLFTGIQVLDASVLASLPPGPSDSVAALYGPLIAAGEMLRALRLPGAWYDLGAPSAYLAAQVSMLSHGFRGRPAAQLIAPGARVEEPWTVWRSVVGDGCAVANNASIRWSVLWEGVEVGAGAEVRHSILTDGVRIAPGEVVDHRLVHRIEGVQRSEPLR